MTEINPELFVLDIEKRLGSEFWSNRYILRAASFANAMTLVPPILGTERSLHLNIVTLTRWRLRTADQEDDTYVITPINLSGNRSTDTGALPLFNTLRFDIPAVSGRPSRKYYRGVLQEGDINGDSITETFVGYVTEFTSHLAGAEGPGIVDPQGQTLTAFVRHPFVQMRQLRRSRRRRTNGGGIFQ